MSGTQVAIPDFQVPAHLKQNAEALAKQAAATGGIKAGGFPRLSLAGGKFHVVSGGEKRLITNPEDPTLPLMRLEGVIVGWSPYVAKTFYDGDFSENDDSKEPDCRSDNGIAPDADVIDKQHVSCSTCPKNAWGSKVSKYSGKDTKACTDSKRIVILPAAGLDSEALGLNITPAALKEWKKYVDVLTSKGVSLDSVVTGFTFDPSADFPKLMFKWIRFLEDDEYKQVQKRAKGEDVLNIVEPRRVVSVREDTPQIAAPAAPAAPAAVVAKEDQFAHIPAEIRATINIVGADSPAGQALIAQYPKPEKKESEPEKKPEPVDPYANVPKGQKKAIKSAVESVGGPDSEPGKAILASFGPKSKPSPAPKEEAKLAAPAAPAAPAGPGVGGYADTGATAGADLNALLNQAMGSNG